MSDTRVFVTLPVRIWNLPNITLQLLKFYEKIFQFWNGGNECFVNNSTLKEYSGMTSDSSISAAFQYFEDIGEMKRIIKNGKRYIIPPTPKLSYEEKEAFKPVDNPSRNSTKISQGLATARGGSRYSEGRGLATARHNINKLNNNKNNKSLCASNDDAHKSFEEFWSVYPRKQNKKRTQQIWLKNKLYEKSKDIISKVLIQIEYDPQWQDKQYIPQPTTYLNGARWDDEIILPNKPKQNLKKIDETPNRYGSMRDFTYERLEEEAKQQKGLNNANESHGSGFATNKRRINGVCQAKDYLLS